MKGMEEELGGRKEESRDTKGFKERNKEVERRVYKGNFVEKHNSRAPERHGQTIRCTKIINKCNLWRCLFAYHWNVDILIKLCFYLHTRIEENILKILNGYYATYYIKAWAWIAQSVQRLATGWTVRGSNLVRGEVFLTRPDGPWGLHSLLYNGYRVFPGGKAAGVWR